MLAAGAEILIGGGLLAVVVGDGWTAICGVEVELAGLEAGADGLVVAAIAVSNDSSK